MIIISWVYLWCHFIRWTERTLPRKRARVKILGNFELDTSKFKIFDLSRVHFKLQRDCEKLGRMDQKSIFFDFIQWGMKIYFFWPPESIFGGGLLKIFENLHLSSEIQFRGNLDHNFNQISVPPKLRALFFCLQARTLIWDAHWKFSQVNSSGEKPVLHLKKSSNYKNWPLYSFLI